MDNWLSSAFQSKTGWKLLTDLVDIDHRLAGSSGERRAAELMRDGLSDQGARNARLDEFPITGWEREGCELSHLNSGKKYHSFALPRSPSSSTTAKLIDLGHGTPEDFQNNSVDGKIVLVSSDSPTHYPRIIHRREKYYYAVKNGAVGFIFRNHINGDLVRTGTVSGEDGPIGEIPAVGVSKETGLRLSRRHNHEEISIKTGADIMDTTSQNVYAEVGPDTDERVIISAHLDGHDISESAKDDAVGIATIIEIAKSLRAREGQLETKVQFVGFGGEEVGFIGSNNYIDNQSKNIKTILQNDGVARSRDLMVHTNGFGSLGNMATMACEKFEHPVKISPKLRLSSDHWPFVKEGIPGYLVSSVPSNKNVAGYGSSRGIILTSSDTIDKLDIRDLRTHAILETELAVDISKTSTSIPQRSKDDIRSQADAEGSLIKYNLY
jgi:Zn-dependent M28 family amino/carboxypeptidase